MDSQEDPSVTRTDLRPAAAELDRLIAGVDDDQLDVLTPCEGWAVRDLLMHIRGFAAASTAAARRNPFPVDSPELRDGLRDDWRERLPHQLDSLAQAWADPQAWEGWAEAGGIRTPATVAGSAALQEFLLHGWDLAQATGQSYRPDPDSVHACLDFLSSLPEEDRARPFGPRLVAPDDAPPLERLLAISGRGRGPGDRGRGGSNSRAKARPACVICPQVTQLPMF